MLHRLRLVATKSRRSLAHLRIETLEDRDVPAAFTPGDLVVYRVGNGSAALTNVATAVFLDEYTTSGSYVQTVNLPTADSGANQTLTASGSATSEGLLTLSTDGHYLLLTGYDVAPGSASPASMTSSAVNRVVGRVDASGKIDTTTALTDFASGSNPRGVASTNGTDLWIGGGAGGVRYTTLGSTTSVQLSTTVTIIRGVEIFDGQLYISTNSGSIRLGSVDTGLPTTSGKTITNLTNFPTSTGSPYAFFFADISPDIPGVDTLYVADDNATGTGGIQKYYLTPLGNWTATGSVTATPNTPRGLTGVVNGTSVTLYMTNGSTIGRITDSTGYAGTLSGSVTTLATAASNEAFRGIAFAPVAANHAPTLNGANNFTAINEDDANNSGTLVSDLISGKVSDDSGDPQGIAITATDASHGSWQYSTDGGSNWNNVGTVSNTSALLLKSDSNTRVRFVPAQDFNGTVTNAITFRAWDQFTGTAGNKVDTSSNGGNTAFSSTTASPSITVNAVNDAPTLSGSNNFTAINEDDTNSGGTKVSDLISGKVGDPDSGAVSGIALTATAASNGSWQYTTDGGSNWNNVGSVSDTSALLLKADSNTKLRFIPNADFNGTVSSAVTFRAWDQTSGSAGSKVSTSSHGGATAFSDATANPSITVNAVNGAPTLNGSNNFTAIDKDDVTNSGTLVSDLISGKVSDVDSGAASGIAITATDESNGVWEYTTDGSNWNSVGSVSNTSAILLKADSNTRLRFVPASNFNGTVSSAITFRAWDQTAGSAGDKVDTSTNGGTSAFSSDTASPSITVNAVNDAPMLSGANDFTAVDEDDTNNSGTLVADLIGGKTADVDSNAVSGIALVATVTGNGSWQYTTDGGSNWNNVGTVDSSHALLLKADDNTRLRFIPNGDFNGTVTNAITFRAWDQTSGLPEEKADASVTGGITAFSSVTASPSITVKAVNDAPTLTGANDFTDISEDDTTNSGTKVTDLISGKVSDPDSGAVPGIAIVDTATSNGSWQYTTDGSNWNDVGAVSDTSALLLTADANTSLRFVPNANFNGTVSSALTFRAWDQTSGTAGDKVNTSANGGTTAFSSATASPSITVNAINDAPTLIGANNFSAINEDDVANSGTLVSSLISGQVSDVDSGALSGIAVTTTNTSNGSWEYTTDSGANWNSVGSVSDTTALLLAADTNTRLRFVPNSGFNGTVSNAVTFRAWDQTSGSAGSKADASTNGNVTAFSSATASASILVNAVNDAPALSGANNFSAINEDDTNNAGTLVSALLSGQVSDPDNGAVSGIALTATDTSNGSWQYTTDGSNWNNVGSVSNTSALLLAADSNTRLRFVPASNFNGTVSSAITFRAWDQTSGMAGNKTSTSSNGGTTAFSTATASASITVNAVNDAPTLNGANNFSAINEDDVTNSGTLISALISGKVTDVDSGAISGIAITATVTTNGTWEYTTDGGSNWNDVGSVGAGRALLLAANTNTRLRFAPGADFHGTVSNGLTFRAWDQTSGSAGNKVDTASNGGISAFSTATASASITVNAVNDAPTLTGANDFTAINEDDTANTGTLVSDLIDGKVSDPDSGAVSGIAVTATVTTNCAWEYTIDGGSNWNSVGSVSDSNALLLTADANTRLRFVPASNFNGTVSSAITFRAWDQTTDTAEDKIDTSANGGTTAFSSAMASSSITVKAVNDAPTLSGANNFSMINEDDTTNSGMLVSDLISGQTSDADAGAVSGVAVTATNTSNGSWQYTVDGGSNWNTVGAVSNTSALLLAADANTRLRFVPASNFNGTVSSALTFRAWDQTSGSVSSKVDVSTNGGTTAFSSATASSSITVNAINDAPTLTGANNFSAINEDDVANFGTLISALISGKASDPDSGALTGIAVTTTNTSNGSWEYTTDGGANWNSVGSVSDTSALLLTADTNTRLRFLPGADFNGPVSSAIIFRAWDQTSGSAGTKVDVSTNGGATAFSSASASASITVNAVNDEPSVMLASNSVMVSQDSGLFTQSGFATFNPGGGTDEASQTPTYSLTNTNNALFTSSGQPAIDAGGKLTFTLAPGTSGTAEVTATVTDSGPGTPPNDNAGSPVKFTITVNAVVIVPPVAAQPVSVAASTPTPTGPRFIVLGSDVGTPSRVQTLSATTGAVLADFSPFGSYSGGVRVAVGDITGDGIDDIILATAGTVGTIEVIDGRTGALTGPIMPFGSFPSGLEIAVADIDGDGKADLLVGMQTGGSSVIAFTSRSGIIGPVDIFPGFTGGVRMALGDVNGDGRADFVFGKGPGGDGQILVFDGATRNLIGSFASHPGFPSEVNLAVGDINGDGKAEILTAVAAMFGTEVDAFTPQGNPVRTIKSPTTIGATTGFARSTAVTATNQSARIAAADLNGDHITDILLGSTAGNGGSRLLVIDGATGGILLNEGAFDPLFDFGLSIGVK